MRFVRTKPSAPTRPLPVTLNTTSIEKCSKLAGVLVHTAPVNKNQSQFNREVFKACWSFGPHSSCKQESITI